MRQHGAEAVAPRRALRMWTPGWTARCALAAATPPGARRPTPRWARRAPAPRMLARRCCPSCGGCAGMSEELCPGSCQPQQDERLRPPAMLMPTRYVNPVASEATLAPAMTDVTLNLTDACARRCSRWRPASRSRWRPSTRRPAAPTPACLCRRRRWASAASARPLCAAERGGRAGSPLGGVSIQIELGMQFRVSWAAMAWQRQARGRGCGERRSKRELRGMSSSRHTLNHTPLTQLHVSGMSSAWCHAPAAEAMLPELSPCVLTPCVPGRAQEPTDQPGRGRHALDVPARRAGQRQLVQRRRRRRPVQEPAGRLARRALPG